MARSKNERDFCGGKIRVLAEAARGTQKTGRTHQYDGQVYLLDPTKRKPYTYGQLAAELDLRKRQYPELAAAIDALAADIKSRAAAHPDAVFCRSVRAESRKAAIQAVREKLLPQLEALARVVYRPGALQDIAAGSMTVAAFLQFGGEDIYAQYNAPKAQRLMTVARTVLLPAIGTMPIAALSPAGGELHKNEAAKRINRQLDKSKARSSKRSDTRMAYQGLLLRLIGLGAQIHSAPAMLARLIVQQRRHNTAIRPRLLDSHLTDAVRADYLQHLADTGQYQTLVWVGCIYSGLTIRELCALQFCDLRQLRCQNGEVVYTVYVDKTVHAANHKNTTIGLTNAGFPPGAYRRVVMIPWFRAALRLLAEQMRKDGVPADRVRSLPLVQQGSRRLTPDRVQGLVDQSMTESGLFPPRTIPRSQPGGRNVATVCTPDAGLLRRDAMYLYAQVACLPPQLVDASFGLRLTDEDESHYLDVLGDDAALRRYMALRRLPLPPFAGQTPPARTVLYQVRNPSDRPKTLVVQADYGIECSFAFENADPKEEPR